MHLIVTRTFPPEVGGMQNLMYGLAKSLSENVMIKVFADQYPNQTNFDKERISTLFSNLSSLNILDLNKLKKDYKNLGYSSILVNAHQLKIFSYPIYLAIMVCLSSILMFNVDGYSLNTT